MVNGLLFFVNLLGSIYKKNNGLMDLVNSDIYWFINIFPNVVISIKIHFIFNTFLGLAVKVS